MTESTENQAAEERAGTGKSREPLKVFLTQSMLNRELAVSFH
jgi:hypothetical protein